jgi:hypothetical protein
MPLGMAYNQVGEVLVAQGSLPEALKAFSQRPWR